MIFVANGVMLFVIVAGIFGCIVGSFLNVVTLRAGTGKGLGGRSHCVSCNQQLSWYELIPVVSYVIQRGKCRSCSASISAQYPIVELVTGLLFALPVLALPVIGMGSLLAFVVVWIFTSLAVAISVHDIRHHAIPVSWIVMVGVVGLGLAFIPSLYALSLEVTLPVAIVDRVLAGIVLPLPFFLLWIFSRGRLFGLADVELMIPIGLSLGFMGGVVAIISAFWIATIVVGMMVLVGSRLLRARNGGILKQALPFAPFLLGTWYVMLVFGHSILGYISRYFL